MKQITQTQRKSLTTRQMQLINALGSGMELPEALAQCKVSGAILRKWFQSPVFSAELEYRQELASRQSELLIGRFAPVAASKLINLLESEKEETVRKACLDILQLAGKQSKTAATTTQKPLTVPLSPEIADKMLKLLSEKPKQTRNTDN